MKKLLFILSIYIGIILMFGCKPKALTPQQKIKEVQEEQANVVKIETPNFTFYPDRVEPEFGTIHMLNCSCFLQVTNDRVNSELPYFGHFFLRPMTFDDIPIDFISSKFLYTVHTDDQINFHIEIAPTDAGSIMNNGIVFNIEFNKETAEGTVKVKTDNRDEITYYGYFR